jgi:hypothetical protein
MMHIGVVRMHSPTPQVLEPGSMFVHAPAVIPVHVPAVGVWHVSLQLICTGPGGCMGQIVAGVMHDPAPLHAASALLTA